MIQNNWYLTSIYILLMKGNATVYLKKKKNVVYFLLIISKYVDYKK